MMARYIITLIRTIRTCDQDTHLTTKMSSHMTTGRLQTVPMDRVLSSLLSILLLLVLMLVLLLELEPELELELVLVVSVLVQELPLLMLVLLLLPPPLLLPRGNSYPQR